ncbi:MAG: flagellar biosynthesis protein FlhB [Planctomycetota bacterium]
MPDGDTEKTESATPKKRDEARKQGQVMVSQDLNRAVQLLVVLFVLHFMGSNLYVEFSRVFREQLGNQLTMEITESSAMSSIKELFLKATELLAPFFIAIVVCMVAVIVAQTGFRITFETLQIKFSKLNPLNGVKKIFSLRSVVKLFWSVIKVTLLGWIVYQTLADRLIELGELGGCELYTILEYCFSLLFLILFRLGLALLLLALFDFLYQKWQFEKDLKMTKQEVTDENKQMLGDPLIKRRIRQAQFAIFKQRLSETVPEATVVVTNPTTYAVAIKYEKGKMEAPLVVAKGMNFVAERIKTLARESNIPIVENKMLAQTLYRTVEVGREIPSRLYRAVAEVLSYVYRLKGKI